MASLRSQNLSQAVWRLASRQHGVVALFQLLEIGYTMSAIKHRVATGRLHPVRRGVYAVGRPDLAREGEWMAAVLTCGAGAVLSHGSAAALWQIRGERERVIHVTVSADSDHRQAGLRLHRRQSLGAADMTKRDAIPVTTPVRTIFDMAPRWTRRELEAAVNEADKLDLVDPEALRAEVEVRAGQHGVRALRALLDRAAFVLTDSELERRFLPIMRRAGLGQPQTQAHVNGYRVDFFWEDLGLVVETDGLRYHRTPSQQTRDRIRDQAHTAAGLTQLRFSHWQVRYDPATVQRTLEAVARRCHEAFGISGPL